jgi:hypothetical protein
MNKEICCNVRGSTVGKWIESEHFVFSFAEKEICLEIVSTDWTDFETIGEALKNIMKTNK